MAQKVKTARAVIRSVLRRFEKHPEAWIKYVAARSKEGWHVSPRSSRACRFCLSGAILHELDMVAVSYARRKSGAAKVYDQVVDLLGFGNMAHPPSAMIAWNDSSRRKIDQVVARLRKALEAA